MAIHGRVRSRRGCSPCCRARRWARLPQAPCAGARCLMAERQAAARCGSTFVETGRAFRVARAVVSSWPRSCGRARSLRRDFVFHTGHRGTRVSSSAARDSVVLENRPGRSTQRSCAETPDLPPSITGEMAERLSRHLGAGGGPIRAARRRGPSAILPAAGAPLPQAVRARVCRSDSACASPGPVITQRGTSTVRWPPGPNPSSAVGGLT